jgi:hypothetical protein
VVSDLGNTKDGAVARNPSPDQATPQAAQQTSPHGRRIPIWSPAPGIVATSAEPLQDDASRGPIASRLAAGALCVLVLIVLALLALHSVS